LSEERSTKTEFRATGPADVDSCTRVARLQAISHPSSSKQRLHVKRLGDGSPPALTMPHSRSPSAAKRHRLLQPVDPWGEAKRGGGPLACGPLPEIGCSVVQGCGASLRACRRWRRPKQLCEWWHNFAPGDSQARCWQSKGRLSRWFAHVNLKPRGRATRGPDQASPIESHSPHVA
jgi:hypothetical protein